MSEGITSTKYSQLIEKRDYYQSEALRFKHDAKKAQAFKMLADDIERRAGNLTVAEALR